MLRIKKSFKGNRQFSFLVLNPLVRTLFEYGWQNVDLEVNAHCYN